MPDPPDRAKRDEKRRSAKTQLSEQTIIFSKIWCSIFHKIYPSRLERFIRTLYNKQLIRRLFKRSQKMKVICDDF